MSNIKDLKEYDMLLLTYKGEEYGNEVIDTSIIGMFKGRVIDIEGKDAITVEVINDNAPKSSIVFKPGKIVNFEVTKFKEYTSRRKGLTIVRKKNPHYIELKIL